MKRLSRHTTRHAQALLAERNEEPKHDQGFPYSGSGACYENSWDRCLYHRVCAVWP